MILKKNEVLDLKIEDITNLGFGVGKVDGAVVFVSDTVPGDEASVKIIKVCSSYAVGRVEKFSKKSSLRTEDRCKNNGCRACAYRHLDYSYELKLKREGVREAFVKAGLPDIEVKEVVPSPMEYGYRNKAQYPVQMVKGEIVIGFYAPKSHVVKEASECPLAPKKFTAIINTLRDFFKKRGVSIYDEDKKAGLIRHLYFRESTKGDVLATIVCTEADIPYRDKLIKTVKEKHPEIVGLLINVNDKDTNVILGEEYFTLFGEDYLKDTLAGVELDIRPSAFYQVNHGTAELIYKRAKELASLSKTDTLLDLYCGTGSIGLSMAKDAKEVIGIEIEPAAVLCAKKNAESNGISNASFYLGDASDAKSFLDIAEGESGRKINPDVIILDPPRAGSTEELLSYVSSLSPKRIIYISCNPTTLARDVKFLQGLGFKSSPVEPFDMFPMTGHVESVVCLTRRLDN